MGTNKYVVECFLGGGWFPETSELTFEESKKHIENETTKHPGLQLRAVEVNDRKRDVRDVDLYVEPTYAVKIADAVEQAIENLPENKAKAWYKQVKETLTEEQFVEQVLRMNTRVSDSTKALKEQISALNSELLISKHRNHNFEGIIKDLVKKISSVDKVDFNKELAAINAILESKDGTDVDNILNSFHIHHLNGTT